MVLGSDKNSLDVIADQICVVIPLYNKADHVLACIETIIYQTCKPGEIIVVDDGSTDDSADRVIKHYNNQVTLIQQENRGVSAARNAGIDSTERKFVAFLDADDQWDSHYIEEICHLIEEFPQCDVFATAYQLIYPGYIEKPNYPGVEKHSRCQLENYFASSLGEWSVLTSSSTVVRRTALLNVGKYSEDIPYAEDTDLWYRLALKYKIAFSNNALVRYYCLTEGSMTQTNTPQDELGHSIKLTQLLNNNEISSKFAPAVKKFIAQGLQYLIREHAKRGNYLIATKYLLDKRVYHYFGKSTIKMILALVTPGKIYQKLRKIKHKRQLNQ